MQVPAAEKIETESTFGVTQSDFTLWLQINWLANQSEQSNQSQENSGGGRRSIVRVENLKIVTGKKKNDYLFLLLI